MYVQATLCRFQLLFVANCLTFFLLCEFYFLQARFKLDTDWHKICVFQQMSCIWRASKCRLVRRLVNAKSMDERLQLKPDNIKCMNEWKKFIKLKTSSEFKVFFKNSTCLCIMLKGQYYIKNMNNILNLLF